MMAASAYEFLRSAAKKRSYATSTGWPNRFPIAAIRLSVVFSFRLADSAIQRSSSYPVSESSSMRLVEKPSAAGCPPVPNLVTSSIEHQLLDPQFHYKLRSINLLRMNVPEMSLKKSAFRARRSD
jgi:hypothetical protein